MRSLILVLLLFLPSAVFSQERERCHPKKIKVAADLVVQRLDKDDLSDIEISDNLWNSHHHIYFNYEDIEPLIAYAEKRELKLNEGSAQALMDEYIFYKVKKEKVCFGDIIEKYKEERDEFSNKDTLEGEYIPKDIDDCMRELDKAWSEEFKQKFQNHELDELTEFEIGRTLRNSWGLWSHSRLAKYFEQYGILNPDDISPIILTCYERHFKGNPLEFDKEIERFEKWQQITRQPLLREYPKEVRNVRFQQSIYPDPKNESDDLGAIYFYTDKSETLYWVFNHKYGWKKLTPAEYKETDRADIRGWLADTFGGFRE
jgi:hypothetical protein